MIDKIALYTSFILLVFSLGAPSFAREEAVLAEDIVSLRLKKSRYIKVSLLGPLRNVSSQQFLLSINGENLRKYSFDEIQEKLSGPVGSSVKVEIGYPNGDTETFDICRTPSKRRIRSSNRDPYRGLDSIINRLPSSYPNILETTTRHNDLNAKARCLQAIKEQKDNVAVYINCMLLCHAIGDFKSADRYLALALEAIETESPNTHTGYREKAVIQNLVLLGKLNEAETLCKYHLLPSSSGAPRLPGAITVLDSYSLIPTEYAQKASRELAARIVSAKSGRTVSSFHQNSYWLAQYLESIGQNENALDVYSRMIASLKKASYGPSFSKQQAIAFGLYSRARLEAICGKRALCKKDLDAIKTTYEKLTVKQQKLINKIPEFFPTFTDVDNALIAIGKSSPILPPPKIMSFSNQDYFVTDGDDGSFKQQFRDAYNCSKLISENKEREAKIIAQKLVQAYKKGGPIKARWQVRQNLFLTSLSFAREFADKGWYETSNNQLDLLEEAARTQGSLGENDIGWAMLAAERIYNAKASLREPDWSLIRKANPATARSLRWSNRLRILSMAYYYSNYPNRAKVFIDQAIQEFKNSREGAGTTISTKVTPENRANLFMDAACIYAKRSDFANANNYLNFAFEIHSSLDTSLAVAVLEVASIYNSNGNTKEAISVLERTKGLIPPKYKHRHIKEIEVMLAKLYRKDGNFEKSFEIIQGVIGRSKSYNSIKENQIAAELCERSKNYGQAAKYYYEAGKWRGGRKVYQRRKKLLSKAISCANRVPDFDSTLLSKMYLSLCEVVGRKDLEEGLALRQKAVSFMKDSDPEKAKQTSVMAYIKGELVRRKIRSTDPKSINLQQQDKIVTAKKAAELASKNKSKMESTYWLRLSSYEAEANRIDSAVKHALSGIAAYRTVNVKTHTPYQLLGSRLPCLISKAGFPLKAEMILEKAQERVDSIAGSGSLAAQVQMSHQFEYFVIQKDYRSAEKLLGKFLNTNLNQGRYSPPNHDMCICRMGLGAPYPVESSWQVIQRFINATKRLIKREEQKQAILFLTRILNAGMKQFGDNDYRVGLTFFEIARAHYSSGENKKAYDAYSDAVSIMHQHEGILYILNRLHPDYYNVLRKLKKNSEIDKLEEQKLYEQKNRYSRTHNRMRLRSK